MSELTPEKEAEIKASGAPVWLACPPVDRESQRRLGILNLKVPASWTQDKCSDCGGGVWTGPKQREAKAKFAEAVFLCFECAFQLSGGHQNVVNSILHLGGESSTYTTIEP